jgi:diacylglycerol kinase family enzyme
LLDDKYHRTATRAAWEALRRPDLGESSSGRAFRAQVRKVRARTRRPRLVEVDGNVVGRTPLAVTVHPGALVVLVPPS